MQEYELNSILGQYDMVINGTRKTRGAILCDTDKGIFLLKEVAVSESKVPAVCELYEYLSGQGYQYTDCPEKNKEGEYVSRSEDDARYMMRRWHRFQECDIRKPSDILKAAGNLANLHMLLQKELEHPVVPALPPGDEYLRHNRELKKVRRFMRGVSPKGEFEYAFLKCFEQMYAWADRAVEDLEKSNYGRLYENSVAGFHMIHGEYNYHNIFTVQERSRDVAATTNFDKFKRDVQVEDLYYFLRKVMEKHGWRERLGDNMLNAYSAIKPLSHDETEYLKNRLIYPEKFWKIANSYYRSNKAWISVKNAEKLQLAIRQTKEKERFLENIFAFHL